MLTFFSIIWTSFRMALQELWNNKLRTFLSLFGITIGIFCIIGVLATVDSLQLKIQGEIRSLGTNTVWIDKFDYSENGSNYPWWKYVKRPSNKINDVQVLKENAQLASRVSMFVSNNVNASYNDAELSNSSLYGVTEDYCKIQDIKIGIGRNITSLEYQQGNNVCLLGYLHAEKLFGKPEKAINQFIRFNNRKCLVVGIIQKQGKSLIGGFDFDECILVSYTYFSSIFNTQNRSDNLIIVQAKEQVKTLALIDELRGIMRQLRKLSPSMPDNFALNDIQQFSKTFDQLFAQVNLGGWFIAGLSLLVGAFGVANIMFVTVKERTSQIGLKKALGAKKRTILFEFLLESSFLCMVGGAVGLLLVWVLTLVLGSVLPFQIFIAPNIIFIALTICISLGVIAGIVPASMAAKLDPVVAIRSK